MVCYPGGHGRACKEPLSRGPSQTQVKQYRELL
jgi:hypothetical protein